MDLFFNDLLDFSFDYRLRLTFGFVFKDSSNFFFFVRYVSDFDKALFDNLDIFFL